MKNLKLGRATILAVAMAAAFAWVGTRSATAAVEPCTAEFDAVRASIESAVFVGKNAATDQSSLLAKVEAAEAKAIDGKLTDASDKLLDVADTAALLASAPKPKLEDASGIIASVDAAVACLGVQ